MPRRPPVALLTVALAAACSSSSTRPGPVAVSPAPSVAAAARQGCATLVARLPQRVGTLARRTTTPDPTTTAAWGDPAITLVCGGPDGSARDESFAVDDVRFAIHDAGPGNTWTTLGRVPAVTVTVPDRYENQGELVGYLVSALTAAR